MGIYKAKGQDSDGVYQVRRLGSLDKKQWVRREVKKGRKLIENNGTG